VEKKRESADKPGSVVDSHSSGIRVTANLKQPTREHRGPRHCSPIWPCSERGLPCHSRYRLRGALLPHPFTLTCAEPKLEAIGGFLSAALSVDSRRPDVIWRSALWSPDFPLPQSDSDCLADSRRAA
jgi:hypothetical protein